MLLSYLVGAGSDAVMSRCASGRRAELQPDATGCCDSPEKPCRPEETDLVRLIQLEPFRLVEEWIPIMRASGL